MPGPLGARGRVESKAKDSALYAYVSSDMATIKNRC